MSTVKERQIASNRDTQDAERQRAVERAVEAALSQAGYHTLQHIRYEFYRGTLTRGGRVPSFHMKQVAQAAVSHVSGIVLIDNQLEVT